VKSRSTPLAATLERLKTELVDAVLAAARALAKSSLDKVASASFRLVSAVDTPARPARGARPAPAGRPKSKARPPAPEPSRIKKGAKKAKGNTPQLSLPLNTALPVPPKLTVPKFGAPKLAKDESSASAFAITDPSTVLAKVTIIPPKTRRRPNGSGAAARRVKPPEPIPAEPAVTTVPTLREGEQVARAVVGGGVVLRRTRT